MWHRKEHFSLKCREILSQLCTGRPPTKLGSHQLSVGQMNRWPYPVPYRLECRMLFLPTLPLPQNQLSTLLDLFVSQECGGYMTYVPLSWAFVWVWPVGSTRRRLEDVGVGGAWIRALALRVFFAWALWCWERSWSSPLLGGPTHRGSCARHSLWSSLHSRVRHNFLPLEVSTCFSIPFWFC